MFTLVFYFRLRSVVLNFPGPSVKEHMFALKTVFPFLARRNLRDLHLSSLAMEIWCCDTFSLLHSARLIEAPSFALGIDLNIETNNGSVNWYP